MSKVSKTAKASMGMGAPKEKKVIPDVDLVRMYREGRAAHLWPSLEQSDAVLRTLDTFIPVHKENVQLKADVAHFKAQLTQANDQYASTLALCNEHLSSKYTSLDDAVRQVLQAMISYRDLVRDVETVPHGAGAGAHSGNGGPNDIRMNAAVKACQEAGSLDEPGLTSSQGRDSIGN